MNWTRRALSEWVWFALTVSCSSLLFRYQVSGRRNQLLLGFSVCSRRLGIPIAGFGHYRVGLCQPVYGLGNSQAQVKCKLTPMFMLLKHSLYDVVENEHRYSLC